MSAFNYIALDSNGRRHKGVLEADNERQTRAMLRERQLTPVSVQETAGQAALRFARHIRLRDLSEITRQLAIMVQSGLQVEQALQALSRQNANPVVKSTLASVRSQIMEGKTFAESLSTFPRSFPEIFRSSVKAGERSGHLDIVLGQLADFIENAHQARQKVLLALLYPAVLTIISLLIIVFLMTYIVPDMIRVFADSGHSLPLLTRILITVSDFIRNYGLLLVAGFAALAWAGHRWIKRPDIRMKLDERLLHLPVLGALLLQYDCTRFASTLGMLQESGVPLLQAIEIATSVIKNRHIRQHAQHIARKVSEGVSLSWALEQTKLFPPVLATMAGSGEASGKLGAMLVRASAISQRDTENRTAVLLGLFEPLVLLFMGMVVLMLVIAIILPILNLNKLV